MGTLLFKIVPFGGIVVWMYGIQMSLPADGLWPALLIAFPPSAIVLLMWNRLNDDIKQLRASFGEDIKTLRADMREDVQDAHQRIDALKR